MFALAYLNSHFQTGLKNLMDRAVLAHSEETHHHAHIPDYAKVDEIPFDFERRIMSVVVRIPEGKDRIISKGAPEAIFPRCRNFELAARMILTFWPIPKRTVRSTALLIFASAGAGWPRNASSTTL